MKSFIAGLLILMLAGPVLAGVQGFNGTSNLGLFSQVQCSAAGGLTCAKLGSKMTFGLAQAPVSAVQRTRFSFGWFPGVATEGTLSVGVVGTTFVTQISIPYAVTLTGIAVLNGTTIGTDKYILALFNSSGTIIANTALAGVLTAGASAYQQVPFTATKVVAPGTYWVALYKNGVVDNFYAVPSIGQVGGLAGSVTGQTFGTIASLVLPTTFTADKGPVAYVY